MTKKELDALHSELAYFDGIMKALKLCLFSGSDAQIIFALQSQTDQKLKDLQLKSTEANARLGDLLDKGEPDGSDSTAGPRRQSLKKSRSKNAKGN